MELMKMFCSIVKGQNDADEFEDNVNKWIKDHKGISDVYEKLQTAASTGDGAQLLTVTLFYRAYKGRKDPDI